MVRTNLTSVSDWASTLAGTSQLLMGLTFGSLIAVALVGNILVCTAVYTNKQLRKKENLYFVSLAGADLLLSILVMPFGAVNEIAGHWPFGSYCKYWMCLDILFVTASILHLAAISFDRYSHIHNPMRYEEKMTLARIGLTIFAVWATSATVAFLPLAFDTNFHYALTPKIDQDFINANSNSNFTSSTKYQCEFNLDPLYAILSSLASFYIPCALMILAYGKLYRYARRHSKAIRKQHEEVSIPLLAKPTENDTPINGVQQTSPPTKQHQPRRQRSKKGNKTSRMDGDHKARVTLGVIMGVFLASYLPFFVVNIVRSWCPKDTEAERSPLVCYPDWLFITLTWMGYANSAQNPIIYSIFNRDFRQAFRKILWCGRKRDTGKLPPNDQAINTGHNRNKEKEDKTRRKSDAVNTVRKQSPCPVLEPVTRTRSASIEGRFPSTVDNGSVNR